ncbi:5c55b585-971c-46b1-b3de-5626cef68ec5 [Sclerotinia trifoliorum]|uniref:Mitochondrial import inner membrane translocase subunit TIM54 n=1 Tax=Sclerotinia trifoliorum TaxID=28548 RepID=A0A8H2W090_9HELO|nr:5c55b585-971c-46b1-b3de-5626cef68ec5 [Sclerotinia trifoliorum]
MSDSKVPEAEKPASATNAEVKIDAKATAKQKPPNPMWKYLGFGENFRPRVPSRNWMIFLSITGSFTAAIIYDKREKKRAQRKWCKLVEHIAKEPLGDSRTMPRKLTVFLEGPPTDGLRVAQDHFKEYVKPILVASGLDWEFIQGRREGEIRAELAEKIRNARLPFEESFEGRDPILSTRKNAGIKEFDGPRGDIVLGRHTWKEYIRGLHEGWLGPLTEPLKPQEENLEAAPTLEAETPVDSLIGNTIHTSTTTDPSKQDDASPSNTDSPPEKPAEEKKEKPSHLPPFISTTDYASANLPSSFPTDLDPSAAISFPHILGFLNTPTRLRRFLNRRHLADQIGRDTAAIILSTYRPYHNSSSTSFTPETPEPEQATLLQSEEKEWHKSIHVRSPTDSERTWLEPITLDPRIASRMRKAELTPEEEERARNIIVKEEEIEGWIKGSLRSLGRKGLKWWGGDKGKKPWEQGEVGEEDQ